MKYLNAKPTNIPIILLTACLYLLMLFFAFSVTMIAPMMPILIKQYNLNLGEGGLFVTLQSVGGILSIVVIGILADRLKKSWLIGSAFFLYSLCLFLIGLSPSFSIILGMFFLLGASTKILDTIINAYISDIHSERRALYVNLLHSFFSIGALLGPIYSGILLNNGTPWGSTFRILGTVCLGVLVLYMVSLKITPESGHTGPERPRGRLSFVFTRKILLLCIIMIFYTGHQSGISTWLPMYMEDILKADSFLATIALSTFWAGIILGRLLCPLFMRYFNSKHIILWGNLLGGVVLILALLLNNPFILIAASGITGFLTAATIPLLVVIGCSWYPENSGTVSSTIFFSGTISMMIFPWAVGVIGEVVNFKWGMLVTGFTLIMIPLFIYPLLKKEVQMDSHSTIPSISE